jgi:hypothetical protein
MSMDLLACSCSLLLLLEKQDAGFHPHEWYIDDDHAAQGLWVVVAVHIDKVLKQVNH